ncbi:MAG: class I SAM-dependent methyltransferase [Ginsengibacter sp.]
MFKKLKSLLSRTNYYFSKVRIQKYYKNVALPEISQLYKSRNEKYKYFHHYFWNLSPTWLLEHRKYFSQQKRGFGEDAFHAMWYVLFKEFHPVNILEIGIYRGQTLSLFALLGNNLNYEQNINGISPFTSAGDNVSKYLEELNYYEDVVENFRYFNLKLPILHKGYSTDTAMKKVIQSGKWDLIYIDGNHDYEVAKQDFDLCSGSLVKGGLLVLDDSSLYTDFRPPSYATAGHPGPSQVASEIDDSLFKEILAVGHNRVFKKLQ